MSIALARVGCISCQDAIKLKPVPGTDGHTSERVCFCAVITIKELNVEGVWVCIDLTGIDNRQVAPVFTVLTQTVEPGVRRRGQSIRCCNIEHPVFPPATWRGSPRSD